jgi:hypothetical protein
MVHTTETTYFVLPKGATHEEPRTWEEIEAMAGAGLLEPDTLIFLPEEDDWLPAIEAGLAPFFSAAANSKDHDPAVDEALLEQYRELCAEIDSGADWNTRVQAAEIAIKLCKSDDAISHLNAALERHRYHPRIVREAKRVLSPAERKRLRFFDRVESPWKKPAALAVFAFRGGPLPLLIPALLLAAASLLPAGMVFASPLLFIWVVAIAHCAASSHGIPPTWRHFKEDVRGALLRPLQLVPVVAVEGYGIFFAIAAGMAIAGSRDGSILAVVSKSPLLLMPMLAVTVLYVPAVVVLASMKEVPIARMCDPRYVVSAIRKMETEYIISVGLILLPLLAWAIVDSVFAGVPFVREVVGGAMGSYALLCAGMILGALNARFKDHFAAPAR